MPAGTDSTVVEQRIVEQAARVGEHGAVTGWAALRLWGAAYFDGLAGDRRTPLPVTLVSTSHRASSADSTVSRVPPGPVWSYGGVRLVGPAEALYAELLRRSDIRARVTAIDMACAAPVTSLARFGAWLAGRGGTRRCVLEALELASEHAVSPPESACRLVWELDAGWSRPLVNRDIFDLTGRFIARPDLFDPVRGVAGEYAGAIHRRRARHRSDVDRQERLLAHHIEPFTVVAGDAPDVQVQRMESAARRAEAWSTEPRTWTLDRPPHARRLWTADELLAARRLPV